MNITFLLFITGLTFIVIGYSLEIKPMCKKGTDVRILPRNVYDQIIEDSVLSVKHKFDNIHSLHRF